MARLAPKKRRFSSLSEPLTHIVLTPPPRSRARRLPPVIRAQFALTSPACSARPLVRVAVVAALTVVVVPFVVTDAGAVVACVAAVRVRQRSARE